MALSIKSDEADQLARELAAETGETLTEAVVIALRERLDREHARRGASMRMRLARSLHRRRLRRDRHLRAAPCRRGVLITVWSSTWVVLRSPLSRGLYPCIRN
jgi:antitoxin VapB